METTAMAHGNEATRVAGGRGRLWAGRVMSGLVVAFLLFDGGIKLAMIGPVAEGARRLGYREGSMLGIGVVLLGCVVTYLIPRLSVFGAVLLTGYLGGAIATHVRVDNPLFTHVLFPIYVAALIWGGLYLRDARLRTFVASLVAPRRRAA